MRSRTRHPQQCSDPPQGMCDSLGNSFNPQTCFETITEKQLPNSNSGRPHEPSVRLHQKLKPQSHGGSLVENVGQAWRGGLQRWHQAG